MFLSVSAINSMDDVLCSVIVSVWLKMKKSLAINYGQDTISGVEIKSCDRNVKSLWGVSTSFEFCAIFHFKTIFFNLWKIQVSKNLHISAKIYGPAPVFFKKVFVLQTICFKAKVLKTFETFTDCHIKTCRSLKRRLFWKSLV